MFLHLSECKEHFSKFGGHPLAAVKEDLIEEFDQLVPFGKGNPRTLFAVRDVAVRQVRILKKKRNVVRLSIREGAGFGREYQG